MSRAAYCDKAVNVYLAAVLPKAIAETLHASTHVVHRFLRAGVERVRLAGRVELVQRQLATVFHFDHFLGVEAHERVTNLKPLDKSWKQISR
jgi:hypothetical protein